MKTETLQEWLAKGGKITKISSPKIEKVHSFFITQKARQEFYKRRKKNEST